MAKPIQKVIVYRHGVVRKGNRKQQIEVDENHDVCGDCGRVVRISEDGTLRVHPASPKDRIICKNGGKFYGKLN